MTSRGLTLNNPGYIIKSQFMYEGEVTGDDSDFKTFESMAWGYRAMFGLLEVYRTKYGLDTLRKMMHRYAPTSKNSGSAFITTVAYEADVDPDYPLDTQNRLVMCQIIAAMSTYANHTPAKMKDVAAGWALFDEDPFH